jgi:hypothetical protein
MLSRIRGTRARKGEPVGREGTEVANEEGIVGSLLEESSIQEDCEAWKSR